MMTGGCQTLVKAISARFSPAAAGANMVHMVEGEESGWWMK